MAQSVIDKLEVRDARWVPGALVVVLLSLLGAWLAVQTMESLHQMQRAEERARTLQQTAQALLGKTTGGPLRDAVAQLGLHEPLLKGLALGTLPPDAPDALARLAQARERLGGSDVYVLDKVGTVVAHDTAGESMAGFNLYVQPYLQQALRGVANVYAALAPKTFTRGLYYAAPLYAGDTATGPVVGAVVLQASFQPLDALLLRSGMTVLLLSPQGVAFASTRPDWQYAMLPPLAQERIDEVRALRQFGTHFDNGMASALPFGAGAARAQINGKAYAITRQPVEWFDPAGPWQLVALDDVTSLMPPALRWKVGGGAFVVLFLLGGHAAGHSAQPRTDGGGDGALSGAGRGTGEQPGGCGHYRCTGPHRVGQPGVRAQHRIQPGRSARPQAGAGRQRPDAGAHVPGNVGRAARGPLLAR